MTEDEDGQSVPVTKEDAASGPSTKDELGRIDVKEATQPNEPELDEFGLPIKPFRQPNGTEDSSDDGYESALEADVDEEPARKANGTGTEAVAIREDSKLDTSSPALPVQDTAPLPRLSSEDKPLSMSLASRDEVVEERPAVEEGQNAIKNGGLKSSVTRDVEDAISSIQLPSEDQTTSLQVLPKHEADQEPPASEKRDDAIMDHEASSPAKKEAEDAEAADTVDFSPKNRRSTGAHSTASNGPTHAKKQSISERMVLPEHLDAPLPLAGASEWSHQLVVPQKRDSRDVGKDDGDWQEMPAFAPYNLYDDDGKLIAREAPDSDDEAAVYGGLGGAGKGYTKVNLDEDAQSASSMDENTRYLFKESTTTNVIEEDEEARDPLAQLQATKDLLTEQQRIAYVAVVRMAIVGMLKELESVEATKATRRELRLAAETMKMWGQKMMVRLYAHMDISANEQVMIEQLADHGVEAADLTPTLMQNARVKNPGADPPRRQSSDPVSPRERRLSESSLPQYTTSPEPPPYDSHDVDSFPEVQTPSQLPTTKNLDIDLRWTVLCDLFLLLVADSAYDARSRTLLERVGSFLDVSSLEICKFEKRITDALEMQEAADKENWNEDEHMENRRKLAAKRRLVMIGVATVGGGLVIGLSAGLLAPVIGAGLAAGFTTIGVAGTSGFLAGAGGAAMITTTGLVTGGAIAVRASSRRMGPVKTFEYRPLHNNKRVNLIVTVAGWMNGKVDDVRLPYSTVDPVMGDIYSVLWEPEMLQSMGQTINILATEALTQGLQQVLGSTILVALMASLQLPIVLTKLSYLIDNPWTVSLDRANAAGLILADSLIDRNLGARPVTLVGFSLGSRVIFNCLRELAARGAVGLVQNVFMFGSPVVAKKEEYLRARSIIAGRFVNGYATNDWILGYLFRATSGGIMRVAGLAPVEDIPGLENIDVTPIVPGHMAYRAAMPRLLREVGWSVDGDEFAEIEDPDPDNHQERQREIIAEIDEARKELEKTPKKGRFGFFTRNKKLAAKKEWETYDETLKPTEQHQQRQRSMSPSDTSNEKDVLFDVDAIRAELASEQIQIREIKSTLPPMKLEITSPMSPTPTTNSEPPKDGSQLRATKSLDGQLPVRPKMEGGLSSPSLVYDRTSTPDRDRIPETFETDVLPPPPLNGTTHVIETRPELKPSYSMPSVLGLEHNAWLDESEVTLTFE
ncbi:MAG: hypothetical protein M1823_001139 [Watsoniomyces obsoletus]|nr:MAG: hypothetical protein M1823_001139 [Watsoniomyces obsoletus]